MNPREPGAIVVVGSINIDTVASVQRLPVAGETVLAVGNSKSTGGKGANQAVAAAGAGGRVSLVSVLGNDLPAAAARDDLSSAGVNIEFVEEQAGVSGAAFITVDAHGENTIVVQAGVNATADARLLSSASNVYEESSLLLMQGELPREVLLQVPELLESVSHSMRFVLNLAPVVPDIRRVIALADPLIVNETEAASLLGLRSNTSQAGPQEHYSMLLALFDLAESVVITLGARGAVAMDKQGAWYQPAVYAGPVLDTTGAGDSFVGFVCARLASGSDLKDAVLAGVAAGAATTTKWGASGTRTNSTDVQRILDQAGKSKGSLTLPTDWSEYAQ